MLKKRIVFDEDNLIYNRFDLFQENEITEYDIEDDKSIYSFQMFSKEKKAYLNVWGKLFPESVFEEAIRKVFEDKRICMICITRSRNQYLGMLGETNDIRVPIPKSVEELLLRMKPKGRANIRREIRLLENAFGEISLECFHTKIPDDVIELYFKWKKSSHGRDYHLSPTQYIKEHHVTDVILVKAGKEKVGLAVCGEVEKIVYLENFTYNPKLKKYSPGTIVYVKLLERLIEGECRYLYLGGGDYIYKRRFGSEERKAYTGVIYKQEVLDNIRQFFLNNSEKIAVYGLGGCFLEFKRLSKWTKVRPLYGVDKNVRNVDGLKVLSPQDEFPYVEMMIITLNGKNDEVEEIIRNNNIGFVYWFEIINQAIDEYLKKNL